MTIASPIFALIVALALLMTPMASAKAKGGETPAPNANSDKALVATTDGTTEETQTSKGTNQSNEPPSIYDLVRVTEVENLQYKASDQRDGDQILEKRKAGLNDIIIVHVAHLEALLKRASCQKPYDQKPCREQSISLYLDGRAIRGLQPESGAPKLVDQKASQASGDPVSGDGEASEKDSDNPGQPEDFRDGTLRYHLQRTSVTAEEQDNREHWADLLGLGFGGWKLYRPTDVSVGLADEYPVRSDVIARAEDTQSFYLVRIHSCWLISWALFAFICAVLLWWLATKSDILRDRAPVLWGKSKPYSLSAFQAAWWFMLVINSFVFIWLVTGQYDLSSTALVLLGISLGTGLGATIIDSNKRGSSGSDQVDANELNLLLSDKEQLEAELTRLSTQRASADFDQKKAEYDQKIATIRQKFPNAIGPEHQRFYLDILSDASGISFHRFQMLVWTIILGIFFVYSVLSKLAMPQFSETLLVLMGISAGTYLGFKIPETSTVAPQPMTPPASGGGVGVDDKKDDAQPPPAK